MEFKASAGIFEMIVVDYLSINLSIIHNITIIKVWKIVGNEIHLINKKLISYAIQSIQWIDNGCKIMLWYRMYEANENGTPLDKYNWNNECQIQVSM